MKRLLTAISALIILLNVNALGQNIQDWGSPCFHCDPVLVNENDWGLIFQGTVSKRFNKNIKGEFNLQSRIMDQFKSLKAIMFEPGFKFKLSNHLALKSAFRFTLVPNKDGNRYYYGKNYRVHIAGYYVWHKEGVPLRIQYRTRVEKEDYFFWRNRIKVALNFRKVVKPYSSFEIFNQSDNEGFLDFYRFEAGVKWEVHESFNVTTMYRQEFNYGLNASSKTQVFGLMVNYSIQNLGADGSFKEQRHGRHD